MAEGILPPVLVSVVADVKDFQAKMGQVESGMTSVGTKAEITSAKMTEFGNKAATAMVGIGLGVAAFSVHAAMGFESAMTSVRNSAGLTQSQAEALGKAFLDTAFKSEFSATEMATAYGTVAGQLEALNGKALSTKQTMDVMTASEDLAVAKNIALGDSIGGVVSAMKTFQMPVEDAGKAANSLYVMSDLTGQSVDTLAGQFTKVHASLGVALPTMDDLNSILVDMNTHNIGAGRTMLKVTGAIQGLIAPSTQAKTVMQQIGFSAFDANGQFVGMRNVLTQLAPVFAQQSTDQERLNLATSLFGKSGESMLQIIQAGPAAYDAASAAVQHHADVIDAAKNASKDAHNQLKKLESGFSDMATQLGLAILPDLTKVGEWVLGVINYLKKHPLISEIAKDATIAAFATAVAFKLGGAVKKVFSVGSDIYHAITNLFGKGGAATAANAPVVASLDLNTTALDLNTASLDALTAAIEVSGGLSAAGKAGAGVAEGLGVGAGVGATGAGVAGGVAGETAGVAAGDLGATVLAGSEAAGVGVALPLAGATVVAALAYGAYLALSGKALPTTETPAGTPTLTSGVPAVDVNGIPVKKNLSAIPGGTAGYLGGGVRPSLPPAPPGWTYDRDGKLVPMHSAQVSPTPYTPTGPVGGYPSGGYFTDFQGIPTGPVGNQGALGGPGLGPTGPVGRLGPVNQTLGPLGTLPGPSTGPVGNQGALSGPAPGPVKLGPTDVTGKVSITNIDGTEHNTDRTAQTSGQAVPHLAHLGNIRDQSQWTSEHTRESNRHLSAIAGAVKTPNKLHVTVKVA
jgi:TP901 family phage tail tape measure protein